MHTSQQKLHHHARLLFERNMLTDALREYDKICSIHPDDAQAWHMGSAILGILGRFDEAQQHCEKVIALNPRAHEPYLNLANIHMACNRYSEAKLSFNKALKRKPKDAQTLTYMGALYIKLDQANKAIQLLQQALRSSPDNHETLNNLGVAYRMTGDHEKAEGFFSTAIAKQPEYVDAYNNLAGIYTHRLIFDQAEILYKKALKFNPDNKSTLCNLGKLYQSTGDFDAAYITFKRVLEKNPGDIETLTSIASLDERCGNNKAALTALEPIIQNHLYNTDTAITYSTLCKKANRHTEAISILTNLLKKHPPKNDKINLLFALGELEEDLSNYENAFRYFHKANNLDKQENNVDCGKIYFQSMMDQINKETLPKLQVSSNTSQLPVFIVGMPRSGTSLVEQILSSHPEILAGDERGDIIAIIDKIKDQLPHLPPYPESLNSIPLTLLNEIADNYLTSISAIATKHHRFTDKTPLHGMHLGFINQLLPSSRIIICNRDPVDTCLSIYFHRFNNSHAYAKDLDTLGEFYCNYSQLLKHWTSTLNVKILEVQYENLVENTEKVTRGIIEFCGLKWNDSCLNFHASKRTVNTPSYDQVRKPIYTSSVQRWRHYEKQLQPLISTLKACEQVKPDK